MYQQYKSKKLKKIKKPLALRVERWIKKYPLLSIIISALTAIIMNISASFLWEYIKS